MPTKQPSERTFEWAWVEGTKVTDGLRRRPSAETANDELPVSGVRRGTV